MNAPFTFFSPLSGIGQGASGCARHKLAKITEICDPEIHAEIGAITKMAVSSRFSCLARPMQNPWHEPERSGSHSGRSKMTFNLGSIQQLAVSVLGAVLAASLFVSAAVGPVAQFI